MNPAFRLILYAVAVCISSAVFSQKANVRYTGLFESGMVNGSYETNIALSTSHGIKLKGWSAAIGTGIDYYRFRSVPVYLDVKRFISLGKKEFFIQTSAGTNIAYPKQEQKISQKWWSSWWPPQNDTFSFSNGFYSKAAIGMVFNPKEKLKVSFTVGWSYKSLSQHNYELIFNGSSGYEYSPRTTMYGMHRLYVGLSIGI